MVLLTLEIPEAVEILSTELLLFTSRQIQWINDEFERKTSNHLANICLVEDTLRLIIVEKLLSTGGKQIVLQFYSYNSYQNFENLKKIHPMNKKLQLIIEHIFIIMS